jgi:hypothetical protein
MPKISSYPQDNEITDKDIWIGSDGDNNLITKNFTAAKFAVYINNSGLLNAYGLTDTDKRFVYNQALSSAVWVIAHGLRKFPSVTILDSSGNVVFGDVVYTNEDSLTLTFSAAFTGVAYLN